VDFASSPPVQINPDTQVRRPVRRVVPSAGPTAKISLYHERMVSGGVTDFLETGNLQRLKQELSGIAERAAGVSGGGSHAGSQVNIDARECGFGQLVVDVELGSDAAQVAALIVAAIQANATTTTGAPMDVVSLSGEAAVVADNPRLIQVMEKLTKRGLHKTKPVARREDAMLLAARVVLWMAGCSIYGGFVRDWIVAGEDANDIDALLPGDGGDADLDEVVQKIRVNLPSDFTVTGPNIKGLARALVVDGPWSKPFDIDLVPPSVASQGLHPRVDCDVGNLMISRRGISLKEAQISPRLLTVGRIMRHIRERKFVFLYDLLARKREDQEKAKRRLRKYLRRGWKCLTPLPEEFLAADDRHFAEQFEDLLLPDPEFARELIVPPQQ
jgi:hypothetical protein